MFAHVTSVASFIRRYLQFPHLGPDFLDSILPGLPKMAITRQSKQCGFSIYTFDYLKSKSMVRLVRAEKKVLSGLVFARKIARMILIQNI